MSAARDHEQVNPVADIASWRSGSDLLQVLDRPGRGVERICPALRDEQFAAVVLERAEVCLDGIDEGAGAGVEVGYVGGPVVRGCVVGEVVVD